MARQTTKNFKAAGRYMRANRYGFTNEIAQDVDHDYDNNKQLTWSDQPDLNSVRALSVDLDSRIRVDEQATEGCDGAATFFLNANAGLATQTFYIADRNMILTDIQYSHSTAGSDAGAVTAYISHETGVQAPGGGVTVQVGTFNCKSTANTVQYGALLAPQGNGDPATGIVLAPGDRLSVVFAGTLTALAGVVITVNSNPGFKEQPAVFVANANALVATQGFYLSNRDALIVGAQLIWSAAGTDAGAVTLDITHETGVAAPGAGTSILAAAVSAKTTANTVATPALTATASNLKMIAGDQLSIKVTGTATAVAGVVVVVYLQMYTPNTPVFGYYGQVDANFHLLANGTQASQAFFVADRDYEVVDASAIWSTASAGGTYDVTIDKGTSAPGAGTSVSTGAVATTGTANTVVLLPMSVSRRARLMSQGDRLSIKLATIGALAGFDATVSLFPR